MQRDRDERCENKSFRTTLSTGRVTQIGVGDVVEKGGKHSQAQQGRGGRERKKRGEKARSRASDTRHVSGNSKVTFSFSLAVDERRGCGHVSVNVNARFSFISALQERAACCSSQRLDEPNDHVQRKESNEQGTDSWWEREKAH